MSLEVERRARLRALAHPVRLRILSLLTAAAMTATEVAQELGLTHANASYHLRQLHAIGLLELVGEEKIRGATAKRYRYDAERDMSDDPEREVAATPREELRLVYAALAMELQRRAEHVEPGVHNFLTDAEFWVEPEQWAQLRKRIADASDDLHRAAKPPRTPGTVRVSATVALFRMEDAP